MASSGDLWNTNCRGESADVHREEGLACPVSVHGRCLFWEIMPEVSDLIMSGLETFYHT